MFLVGTILVGAKEQGLEAAIQSLQACACAQIHVLIDTVDAKSFEILQDYECRIFSREWDWDFGAARQALQDTIPEDTKWQIWLDTDDIIPLETCQKIQEIVHNSEPAIYSLPYIYMENGEETYRLYRQRLFPAQGISWKWRAHEHPIFSEDLPRIDMPDMPIIHNWKRNTDDRSQRCVEALRKDLDDYPDETRVMYYLAQSLKSIGEVDESISIYEKYLDTGGWDEERMSACLVLSHMHQNKGDLDKALAYAKQSNNEKDMRRETHQRIAEVYYAMEEWQNVFDFLEWELDIPFPANGTFHVLPDHYRDLPYRWMPVPCWELGLYEKGLEYAKKVLEYFPEDKAALNNIALFEHKIAEDKPVAKAEQRKPIVYFYVGYSCERWNSESVNKGGIGGRETSNIWMAKEFHDLGWDVILFADCQGMDGEFDGVLNVDYPLFQSYCERKPPDVVFTSGRTTILDLDFVAKMKIFWIHDIAWGDSLEEWPDYLTDERRDKVDKFVFMSEAQKAYLTRRYGLPADRSYLSRSGIKVKERFSKHVARNRYRLIYTSSADRGLERLLDFWPEIKDRVAEAELHVYYGFLNAITSARSRSDDEGRAKEQWMQSLIDKMEALPGVEYHDRIPQDQLAEEFQKSSIWAYPTHFWETMCLSAIEASAAGCAVVASDLAALHTTVGKYGTLIRSGADSVSYKHAFIDEVVRLLTDDVYWAERSELAKENVYGQFNKFGTYYWDWKAIAQEWDEHLRAELGLTDPTFHQLDDEAAFDYLSVKFQDYMQDKGEIVWTMKAIREHIGKPLDAIVEIGCGYGANLAMLSRLLSDDGIIIGIDPELGETCSIQTEPLMSLFPKDNLMLIHEKSQDPAAIDRLKGYLAGEKIDLAFIDGDHSYEGALADWTALFPFMNDTSIVVFHDIAEEPCRLAFEEVSKLHRSAYFINENIGTGLIFLEPAVTIKSDAPNRIRSALAREGLSVASISNDQETFTATIEKPTIDKYDICDMAEELYGVDVTYPDSLYEPGIVETFTDARIEKPEVSIIVIAHKQKDERTIPCIGKIKENVGGLSYELIGVDDGSKDGTSEFFQREASRTVVLTPRQGVCAAANAGLKIAQAPYVCIIQNDVDLPEGLIVAMYEGLIEHSDWGMVVGWHDQWEYSGTVEGGFAVLPCELDNPNRTAWDVYVPGPCRMYRMSAFTQAGFFDKYQYNAWDDHDTILAMQSAGYQVAACVQPKYSCFDSASTINDPLIYTDKQRARRFLSYYYFHLKWGFILKDEWLRTLKRSDI